MTKAVLISYSNKDEQLAIAMYNFLGNNNIPCWIAARDIEPGASYAGQITKAIKGCSLMVLVYSEFANQSEHVDREIELCSKYKKSVLPFKIDSTPYNDEKEYYLSKMQWIDAYPNPETFFGSLAKYIAKIINISIPSEPPKKIEKKETQKPKSQHSKVTSNKRGNDYNSLAHDFGIETSGSVLTVIAKKGTKLPFEHKVTFSTSADNQPAVEVHLLSGNSSKVSECKSLGKSKIEIKHLAKKGIPQIEITFTISDDGRASVELKDLSSGVIKWTKLKPVEIIEKYTKQEPLITSCPKCGVKIRISNGIPPLDKAVKIKCPKCSHQFKVTNSSLFGLFTTEL